MVGICGRWSIVSGRCKPSEAAVFREHSVHLQGREITAYAVRPESNPQATYMRPVPEVSGALACAVKANTQRVCGQCPEHT
jgi:hypothetical protein